jgi:hypothetical protein
MFVWMSFLPGGGIDQSRIWAPIQGPPRLPAPSLTAALDRCIAEKPQSTSPPNP